MVRLIRTQYEASSVRGVLFIPGVERVIHTIENPWLENEPQVSCIPTGEYDLVENYFFKGGYNSVEITPVENRDEIQIHVGNTATDVLGCVAVGLSKGVLSGKPAVLESRRAFFDIVQPALLDMVPTRIVVQDLEASPLEPMPLEELETADITEILKDKGFWDFTG